MLLNDVDIGGDLQFFLSFHDLFLGVVLDMWKDQERLRAAYYDKVGITGLFIKNGMRNALALLGHEVSTKDEESWVYEVDINEHLHQVEMYLKFPTDLKLPQHQVHIRYFLKKKSHPLHLYAL
jgi:uncharacterized SAM-dependent methyltransferase